MNRKNMQNYQMLTRVVDFGTRNVGLFPKNSAAAEILDALKSGVKQMSDRASAQVSAETAMRIGQGTRMASRSKLRGCLMQAKQVARALNNGSIRPPVNNTDQALIDSGHAFALDAESMKKDFIKHGLPAQFTEDVSAAVQELEQAILGYTAGKALRFSAIREFGEAMDAALATLQRFDTLVSNALKDNSAAMASYTVARCVQRLPVRKRAKKGDPEAIPAPVAVPAPALTKAAA